MKGLLSAERSKMVVATILLMGVISVMICAPYPVCCETSSFSSSSHSSHESTTKANVEIDTTSTQEASLPPSSFPFTSYVSRESDLNPQIVSNISSSSSSIPVNYYDNSYPVSGSSSSSSDLQSNLFLSSSGYQASAPYGSLGSGGGDIETRLSSRVVNTKYGALRGYIASFLHKTGLRPVEVYLAVPYASPPVDRLRFMPPVTPAHWNGVKTSVTHGPVCPQRLPDISNETAALEHMTTYRLAALKRMIPFLRNQSEDCLTLNIYTPAHGKSSHNTNDDT